MPAALERPVSFAKDVHPILAARCYECHSGDQKKGGLRLDSREAVLEGGKTGPVVELGESASSYLIELVAGLDPDLRMPEKGPELTAEEVATLRAWIDQGLDWDLTVDTAAGFEWPVQLQTVELPAEIYPGENPIDRILRPYFDEFGVERKAAVSDERFARRAHLDLVGLPPAAEALRAFVADERDDKRARLVRSLLADRRAYAEHWMTFWNDALRNDFQGPGYIDGGRRQITDWLYEALYQNTPYDQFAAQLVNPNDASEGFVYGIVWRGVTAANEQPPIQAARSVAQVFLGVNLKCASCHDSFVDRWTLKEAYGLASVFADGPLELVRCDVPEGEMAKPSFLWPEVGTIDSHRPKAGRRAQLARILTSEENGFFARTIVNRLWDQLMGRGIVEPLETIENEPWHYDLVEWLAQDLVDHGYDLKHTLERIATSDVYQWPSVDDGPGEGEYVFRGPHPRRLSAEQFSDVLSSVTGHWNEYPRFALPHLKKDDDPSVVRAWRVVSDPLTRALGRPNREQVTLRRAMAPTTLQSLELTNGRELAERIAAGAQKLLETTNGARDDIVNRVFLVGLQREPVEAERQAAVSMLGDTPIAESVADCLWAVAMLPEFQYIY